LSEALAIFRTLGASHDIANQLCQIALLLSVTREPPPALEIHALLDECVVLAKVSGDQRLVAEGGCALGYLAFIQGDLDTAYPLVSKSVSFYRRDGDRREIGTRLTVLGRIVTAQGDYSAAEALFAESLALGHEINDMLTLTLAVEGLIQLALAQEQRAWAVRLCGAAEKLHEASGTPLPPFEREPYQRTVTALCAFFGKQIFATLWAEGRAMSPEAVLATREAASPETAVAVQEVTSPQQAVQKASIYPDGLSVREVEVLRLLAQGWSDAQIAEHLVISPRTVNSHLTSIYRKLQITTRTAATRYTIEHRLV
jgi:DNA-binding CsgD family transcriptional regulator